MQVDVRCYGEVADAMGTTEFTQQLADGATVGDLLESIRADHPTFDPDALSGRLVAMRERRHLDETETLADGDTVALSQSPMRE
jgi:molybdopterin converting factor small subunit